MGKITASTYSHMGKDCADNFNIWVTLQGFNRDAAPRESMFYSFCILSVLSLI